MFLFTYDFIERNKFNFFGGFNNVNGITWQCAALYMISCKECLYLNIYENNFVAVRFTDHKYCNQISFAELNKTCYNETTINTIYFHHYSIVKDYQHHIH
eukprot:100752_1